MIVAVIVVLESPMFVMVIYTEAVCGESPFDPSVLAYCQTTGAVSRTTSLTIPWLLPSPTGMVVSRDESTAWDAAVEYSLTRHSDDTAT